MLEVAWPTTLRATVKATAIDRLNQFLVGHQELKSLVPVLELILDEAFSIASCGLFFSQILVWAVLHVLSQVAVPVLFLRDNQKLATSAFPCHCLTLKSSGKDGGPKVLKLHGRRASTLSS